MWGAVINEEYEQLICFQSVVGSELTGRRAGKDRRERCCFRTPGPSTAGGLVLVKECGRRKGACLWVGRVFAMIYLFLRDTCQASVVRLHRQAAVVVVAVVGDHDVQLGNQSANLQRQHRAKRKGVVDAGAWHAACLQAIRGLAPLAGFCAIIES